MTELLDPTLAGCTMLVTADRRAGELGDGLCTASETEEACPADCQEPADDCEEDCPPPPRGCGGSEVYVLHDLERRVLVESRESMRVSWFTTAGTFEVDHTGRDADESSRTSDDVWIAPDADVDATIFVVLRDDRGGTGYRRYRLRVGGS